MKTKNPLLPMKKLLAVGALALFQQMAFAQNVILNPSFEDGPQPSGNGPYYLGGGWVDHWVGENIAFPGMTYNNGNLYSNTATGSFWSFPAGFSAYHADRAISVVLDNSSGTYHGSRAIGRFSAPLGEGCWSLCIHLSSTGLATPQTVDPQVEVYIFSSAGLTGERIIETFTLPRTRGWRSKGKMFNVSFFKAGKYDRIGVRIKQNLPVNDYHGVFIDDVSLSSCGTTGVVLNPDFNYQVQPFQGTADGGGINPIVKGDAVEEYEDALHYWELSAATSTGNPNEQLEWNVLPEYSFTTLDGHYNSGEITLAGPDIRYKLEHILFSPCGLRVVKAYDLATQVEMAPMSLFEPTGNETGGGEGEGNGNFAQKAGDKGVSMDPDAASRSVMQASGSEQIALPALFSFSPNPATSELNIQISEDAQVSQATSSIMVVNDKGATVLSTNGISYTNRIDLSTLPKGIYYIRVITDNRVDVQKFIKQ